VAQCDASAGNALSLELLDPALASNTLILPDAVSQEEGAFRLSYAARLSGLCSNEVETVNYGLGRWRDGSAFRVTDEGSLQTDQVSISLLDAAEIPLALQAALPPGMVAADEVSQHLSEGQRVTNYVGVWPDGRGGALYGFMTIDGKLARAPKLLLRSRFPIESVRRFPTLHVPSGTISLILREQDNARLVLYLGWYASNWLDQ